MASILEEGFLNVLLIAGRDLPNPVREHVFDSKRKWRFDFCWPEQRVAVEVEGGLNKAQSGHRSKAGIQRDVDKYNAATVQGWKVLRVTADMLTLNPVGFVELLRISLKHHRQEKADAVLPHL